MSFGESDSGSAEGIEEPGQAPLCPQRRPPPVPDPDPRGSRRDPMPTRAGEARTTSSSRRTRGRRSRQRLWRQRRSPRLLRDRASPAPRLRPRVRCSPETAAPSTGPRCGPRRGSRRRRCPRRGEGGRAHGGDPEKTAHDGTEYCGSTTGADSRECASARETPSADRASRVRGVSKWQSPAPWDSDCVSFAWATSLGGPGIT
jgi:hypothetical protein